MQRKGIAGSSSRSEDRTSKSPKRDNPPAKKRVDAARRRAKPDKSAPKDAARRKPEVSKRAPDARKPAQQSDDRMRDRRVCKVRPDDTKPKGGGGGAKPRKFIPWCDR